MTAAAFQEVVYDQATTSAAGTDVDLPAMASATVTDYQIVVLGLASSGADVGATPAGWVLRDNSTIASNASFSGTARSVLYEIDPAATLAQRQAAFQTTLTGGRVFGAARLRWSLPAGSSGRTVAVAKTIEALDTASTSHALPAVTTVAADSLCIGIGVSDQFGDVGEQSWPSFGTYTGRVNTQQGNPTERQSIGVGERLIASPTAGVTGTFTTLTADECALYQIVIDGVSSSTPPTFGSAGTVLAGLDAQTSAAIPAPAGVALNDIVLVQLYKENGATVTMPSGFTEVDVAPTTTGSVQWHHVFWKRATASEPSTYNFSWTGSTYRAGVAHRYAGAITTGSPVDVSNKAARSTSGATTPAVAVTTTGADRLLVWLGSSFSTVSWTPPSGFTLRAPPTTLVLAAATKAQAAAGASGSITGVASASATQTAWLLALIPAGAVAAPVVDGGADVTSHTVNTALSRTATITGSGITAQGWEIQSAPAGVTLGTIDTDASLSWTPTVTGAYVLRAFATNATGTTYDPINVTVVAAGGGASGYPSIVQAAQMISPARPATTCVGTITAATAGQAIVAAVAGDKNTGTVQFSDNINTNGAGWSEVFELTSTSTSLYLAFKTSVGGETTITATHSGSSVQGDTGWIAVLTQTGTAAWGLLASASNITDEVGGATWATGTTGAASFNGLGFALVSIDSIVSITGVPSWSNGYVNTGTNGNTPPAAGVAGSGGGSGGLYAATKQVDAATTTTSTFATNGGSDQLTGAIAVFGRQGSGPPVGTGTVLRNPRVGVDKIGLRLSGVTSVRVDFSLTSDMASPISSSSVTPSGLGDAHVPWPAGLTPGTTYYFQPYSGAGYIGTARSFKVPPGAAQSTFKLGFSSCRATDADTPVLTTAISRGMEMFLHLGDAHYRDISSTTASLYRDADDELFQRTALASMLTTIPHSYVWSDHDFCGNASTAASTGKATVRQVYRERVPSPTLPSATGGIYHTFTAWGARLRIIMLDTRSYRDSIGTTSDGTMLGTEQLTWLQGLLAAPDTPLTFIVSAEGWHSAGSDDDWGFYQNERATIAGWITASSTEVVFLCGDMHRMAIATPADGTPGDVHVWHAAALNQFDNGVKGGPYTSTQTYYAAGSCGLIELADSGTQITATFRGLQSGTSDWSATDTVTVPLAVADPARFFMAAY